MSNSIENALSLADVVDAINSSDTPESLALEYALDAATEAGYGTGVAEVEAHLDVLEQAGAQFDYGHALSAH